jgi:recombination protein RecT
VTTARKTNTGADAPGGEGMNKQVQVQTTIFRAQQEFNQLALLHKAVNWQREAGYACQIMEKNDFTRDVAIRNPESLKRAVVNVAAVGLSLSPVHKHAYLVPRKGEICLDVSYLGFIHLAAEAGAILWAMAEIVHKKDEFQYLGVGEKPKHVFDPFDNDRGEIVGAYCVAKMPDKEYLTVFMSIGEIYSIRDKSDLWKKKKAGPWKDHEGEMIKKTVIKRAYKSWPLVDKSERFHAAMDVSNSADPVDFNHEEDDPEQHAAACARARELLKEIIKEEKSFAGHCSTVFKRNIETMEDMSLLELDQSIVLLQDIANTLADKKRGAEAKTEPPHPDDVAAAEKECAQ